MDSEQSQAQDVSRAQQLVAGWRTLPQTSGWSWKEVQLLCDGAAMFARLQGNTVVEAVFKSGSQSATRHHLNALKKIVEGIR